MEGVRGDREEMTILVWVIDNDDDKNNVLENTIVTLNARGKVLESRHVKVLDLKIGESWEPSNSYTFGSVTFDLTDEVARNIDDLTVVVKPRGEKQIVRKIYPVVW